MDRTSEDYAKTFAAPGVRYIPGTDIPETISEEVSFKYDSRYYTPDGKVRRDVKAQIKKHYEKIREDELTLFDEAFSTNNTIFDIASEAYIRLSTPPEEGFKAYKVPGLLDDVDPMFVERVAKADSLEEALALKGRAEQYMENLAKLNSAGWAGGATQFIAAMLDADAVLIPFTGGSLVGPKVAVTAGKMGIKNTRALSTIAGATAGAEAATLTTTIGAYGTVGMAEDLPSAVLTSMAFGAGIGAATPKSYKQMQLARDAAIEYKQAKNAGFTRTLNTKMSVGSASPVAIPVGLRDSTKEVYTWAASDINARTAREIVTGKLDAETTNTNNWVGRAAQKAQNWIDKSPMRSLHTTVGDLGVVGSKVAYDLLPHPGGMLDGMGKPAAYYDELYVHELGKPIIEYQNYALRYMERSNLSLTDKAKNAVLTKESYDDFNRQLLIEMETRFHEGTGNPHTHHAITEYADELDAMHSKAITIQQGMAGEEALVGSESLQPKSGYIRRLWSGDNIRKIEKDLGPKGREILEDALYDGYLRAFDGVDIKPDVIRKIVKAIITRAKAISEGIDTNVVGLLRTEGKEYLREMLKNNKMPDAEVDSVINALTGVSAERAKPGFLKDRIDLDMRTPIPGTDKVLLDLLDQDVYRNVHKYVRKVAGSSALARKGYQPGKKTEIIEAIKDELAVAGKNSTDPKINDILETTFSYFGEGSIGSGVDPLVLDAMRVTRMSLLGHLGLTNMGELGSVIAQNGVKSSVSIMPKEMKSLATGELTPTTKEMHDAFIFLDQDHLLYDEQLALDFSANNSAIGHKFTDYLHKVVAKGSKIHGYTSLFYQSMQYGNRVNYAGTNAKIMRTLQKEALSESDTRRLIDTGLDDDVTDAIRSYIQDGTIVLKDDYVQMNYSKWKPNVLQEYKLALHQISSRNVQRHLAGEEPYWMTKTWGRVMSQFRGFSLMALQKQSIRHLRLADEQTAAFFTYSLGVAAIVYATTQAIKGNTHNLTADRIAKGAINYSPATGWLPMMSDPVMEVMGLEQFKMNKYGPPGRATDGVIPTPPVIPTMNRMAHLPGAVLGTYNGVDKNEASALASTPIIGSMYGFNAYFNHLKNTD